MAQPHESVLSRTARAYKNFRLYPPTRGSTWAWYLASAEKPRKPGFLLQIFYESIQIFYNIFPRGIDLTFVCLKPKVALVLV